MKCAIIDNGEWIDINAGPNTQPRASGIHLSGIIEHIALLTGRLYKDDREALTGFSLETKLMMALGLAWEDWLAYQLPHVDYHFGELELNGILCTPDGVDCATDTLYEFKTTRKSSFKVLDGYDKQWMWISQNQGYCKMLGWRKVRQIIYFLNGDYHPPTPQLITLGIEYSQAEIDNNWALMLKYRDAAKPESYPHITYPPAGPDAGDGDNLI